MRSLVDGLHDTIMLGGLHGKCLLGAGKRHFSDE